MRHAMTTAIIRKTVHSLSCFSGSRRNSVFLGVVTFNAPAPDAPVASFSTTAPANLGDAHVGRASYLEDLKDVYSVWDSQVRTPNSVQQGAAQLVGVDGHGHVKPSQVSTREQSAQRECSKCKQPGHNRSNRLCPLFG